MSCWRRMTVLRVPAICLGFDTWEEWDKFIDAHKKELHWRPGCFATGLCGSYPREAYDPWLPKGRGYEPWDRLDMNLYPDVVPIIPGPFLDYCLEDIAPLSPEENTYNACRCARPLTPEEKAQYLPLYQALLPGFTPAQMDDVHYCRYEWYDGADASYLY